MYIEFCLCTFFALKYCCTNFVLKKQSRDTLGRGGRLVEILGKQGVVFPNVAGIHHVYITSSVNN